MNSYVQVSYNLYSMFEKALKNALNCEITFLKEKNNEVTLNSKIVKLKNVNNNEFIETEDGTVIRLDHIKSFNGEETATINHY